MKRTHLLYGLATLAVAALLAGIISYATETHPTQTDVTTAPVEKTVAAEKQASAEITATVKKKNCGCCAERIARLQEQIRKARERRQAAQRAETNGVQQMP